MLIYVKNSIFEHIIDRFFVLETTPFRDPCIPHCTPKLGVLEPPLIKIHLNIP